jgi:carbamoylphosphate synthase large subunit
MINDIDKFKVEGREDLVRDSYNKAILSTDKNALQKHREKKEFFKGLLSHNEDINNLKEEMREIKALLHQIVKREN